MVLENIVYIYYNIILLVISSSYVRSNKKNKKLPVGVSGI